jgi:hypothetical protein
MQLHSFFCIMRHMKLRLFSSLMILIVLVIIYPGLLLVLQPYGQGLITVMLICIMTMLSFFVFSGLQKLIVYFIYIFFTILFLIILPSDYQVLTALTATFIMIIHPLSKLETFISKQLSPNFANPIQIHLSGSYWPYFEYRKAMKAFYHLPQSKKLHQNRWYLLFRQLTTLLLLFIGVFILINETSAIVNALNDFNITRFFSLYVVFWFFLMTYYVYKKGFTTLMRALMIGIFPLMIYILIDVPLENYFKIPMIIMIALVFIFVVIFEYQRYFDRVTLDVFDYMDETTHQHVYANSLFEPIIYNDTYILSSHYLIKISLTTFHRHLQSILIYTNKKHIILTAYAYGDQMLHLYADFHFKDRTKVDLFKTYLESLFIIGIPYELFEDKHKFIYEKRFYHQPTYIVSRANHLSKQLEDVSNEKIVIVSLFMYFEDMHVLKTIQKFYQFQYLSNMSTEEYHTIKIDLPILNNPYIITTSVQEVLNLMTKHEGHFIRILVSKLL